MKPSFFYDLILESGAGELSEKLYEGSITLERSKEIAKYLTTSLSSRMSVSELYSSVLKFKTEIPELDDTALSALEVYEKSTTQIKQNLLFKMLKRWRGY